LREAIRFKEDFTDAHNNLGVALRNKGLLDEAIIECRQLKKDFADAHNNLGIALANKGDRVNRLVPYGPDIRPRADLSRMTAPDEWQTSVRLAAYSHLPRSG
jgi:hypothetical protein